MPRHGAHAPLPALLLPRHKPCCCHCHTRHHRCCCPAGFTCLAHTTRCPGLLRPDCCSPACHPPPPVCPCQHLARSRRVPPQPPAASLQERDIASRRRPPPPLPPKTHTTSSATGPGCPFHSPAAATGVEGGVMCRDTPLASQAIPHVGAAGITPRAVHAAPSHKSMSHAPQLLPETMVDGARKKSVARKQGVLGVGAAQEGQTPGKRRWTVAAAAPLWGRLRRGVGETTPQRASTWGAGGGQVLLGAPCPTVRVPASRALAVLWSRSGSLGGHSSLRASALAAAACAHPPHVVRLLWAHVSHAGPAHGGPSVSQRPAGQGR